MATLRDTGGHSTPEQELTEARIDAEAPELVGSPVVSPTVVGGPGQIEVSFVVDEVLGADPLVALQYNGNQRDFLLTANAGESYTYTYALQGDESGIASIDVSLVDQAGNVGGDTLLNVVTIDTQAAMATS